MSKFISPQPGFQMNGFQQQSNDSNSLFHKSAFLQQTTNQSPFSSFPSQNQKQNINSSNTMLGQAFPNVSNPFPTNQSSSVFQNSNTNTFPANNTSNTTAFPKSNSIFPLSNINSFPVSNNSDSSFPLFTQPNTWNNSAFGNSFGSNVTSIPQIFAEEDFLGDKVVCIDNSYFADINVDVRQYKLAKYVIGEIPLCAPPPDMIS